MDLHKSYSDGNRVAPGPHILGHFLRILEHTLPKASRGFHGLAGAPVNLSTVVSSHCSGCTQTERFSGPVGGLMGPGSRG